MPRTRFTLDQEPYEIPWGHCCGCHQDGKLFRVSPSRYRCGTCASAGGGPQDRPAVLETEPSDGATHS